MSLWSTRFFFLLTIQYHIQYISIFNLKSTIEKSALKIEPSSKIKPRGRGSLQEIILNTPSLFWADQLACLKYYYLYYVQIISERCNVTVRGRNNLQD